MDFSQLQKSSTQQIDKSQENMRTFHTQKAVQYYNYVLGTIYGAIIGNHIGAVKENKIDKSKLDESLHMSGGGHLYVQRGEIMEESCLQLILLQHLTTIYQGIKPDYFQTSNIFSLRKDEVQKIAMKYHNYYELNTLGDFESVTRKAFCQTIIESEFDEYLEQIQIQSRNQNSNGHLARVLPIALIFTQYDIDGLKECIQAEMEITHHSTPLLLNMAYTYAYAIILILQKQMSLKLITQIIYSTIADCKDLLDILESDQLFQSNICSDVIDESQQESIQSATRPWKYCMNYLKEISEDQEFENRSFEVEMQKFCQKQSNLKINLLIFGGFIGSIFGIQKVPDNLKIRAYNSLAKSNQLKIINEFISSIKPLNCYSSYRGSTVSSKKKSTQKAENKDIGCCSQF